MLILGLIFLFVLFLGLGQNKIHSNKIIQDNVTKVHKSSASLEAQNNKMSDTVYKGANQTSISKITTKNTSKSSLRIVIKKDKTKVTNKNVVLTISASKGAVEEVKWAKGKKGLTDFNYSGNRVKVNNNQAKITVKKNGTYSIYSKNQLGEKKVKTVKITNIDKTAPNVTLQTEIVNNKTRIAIKLGESRNNIKKVIYCEGIIKNKNSSKWNKTGITVKNKKYFTVNKKTGSYSVLVIDKAGNKTVRTVKLGEQEMRAVWISFLEYDSNQVYNMTETQFQSYINKMFNNIVNLNMNTVIVQVRPYADAMYQSSYFPTSRYAVGKEGKALSYDPLQYMVEAAHKQGLEIHAWINPYRITTTSTNINTLSSKNQARVWRKSSDKNLNRNVLTFDGGLYYNPAKKDVHNLIVNGVKEIVKNYSVDGIHFDDYFYPALGNNYQKNFDYKEYKEYKTKQEKNNQSAMSIVFWRRNNVDILVKQVYRAIKNENSNVKFGISPAGSLENLYTKDRYYCDVKKWMKQDGYIDYICPQIYWSFNHSYSPYKKTLLQWTALSKKSNIDLFVGIAAYRTGSTVQESKVMNDMGWANKTTVLREQILYARQTGKVNGFMFYRYENLISTKAKKEVNNLKKVLQ